MRRVRLYRKQILCRKLICMYEGVFQNCTKITKSGRSFMLHLLLLLVMLLRPTTTPSWWPATRKLLLRKPGGLSLGRAIRRRPPREYSTKSGPLIRWPRKYNIIKRLKIVSKWPVLSEIVRFTYISENLLFEISPNRYNKKGVANSPGIYLLCISISAKNKQL